MTTINAKTHTLTPPAPTKRAGANAAPSTPAIDADTRPTRDSQARAGADSVHHDPARGGRPEPFPVPIPGPPAPPSGSRSGHSDVLDRVGDWVKDAADTVVDAAGDVGDWFGGIFDGASTVAAPKAGRGQTSTTTFNTTTNTTGNVSVTVGPDVPADAPIPTVDQVSYEVQDSGFMAPGQVTTQVSVTGADGDTATSDTDFDTGAYDFSDLETENTVTIDGWEYTYEVQFSDDSNEPTTLVITGAEPVG